MNTLHEYVSYRSRFQCAIVARSRMRIAAAGLHDQIYVSCMIGTDLD
jgi:hypothetical protein